MSFLNPSIQQVLRLNLQQGRSYVRYLIQHNSTLQEAPSPAENPTSGLWSRRHHQLPCSAETRRKRAQLFATLVKKQDPVCLLGDDDGVGPELVRMGFEQVTVYDCDEALLQRMAAMVPPHLRQNIRLIPADIRHLEHLQKGFARLVVFDPPYHTAGFMSFARAALHAAMDDQPVHIIGMTVPEIFCNRSDDWQQIQDYFRARQLQLQAHYHAFNIYPIASGSQWLLRVCAGLLTPGSMATWCWRRPLYFFSDCMIWERRDMARSLLK